VPAQDRGGCDEQSETSAGGEQSGQRRDQGSAGPVHLGSRCASLEHGELVTQNQDLDLVGGAGSSEQDHPSQEPGHCRVDQPQRHRRIMPNAGRRRSRRSPMVGRVLGTHTLTSRGVLARPTSWPAPRCGSVTGASDCRGTAGVCPPRRPTVDRCRRGRPCRRLTRRWSR
jgi:hypothetical protein